MEDDLKIEELLYKNGSIDMKLGGENAKIFMISLIKFFEQNKGENFLSTTVQGMGKKYSIDITNLYGNDSPAERLQEMQKKLDLIWKEINNAYYLADMKPRNYYNTIHEIAKIIKPDYEEIGKEFIK